MAAGDPPARTTQPPHDIAVRPVGLYVHVPFCVGKCDYCDFYSLPLASCGADHGDAFAAAVLRALDGPMAPLLANVPTLYFGGGTPTALGDALPSLVSDVLARLDVREGREVTVETNPEVTSRGLLRRLVEAGANRFSLGVQSFDDDVLSTLGRRHDAAGARAAIRALYGAGAAFSIDLICGVPDQSMASWRGTLHEAVASHALHVSVYPLTIESGTPMAQAMDQGLLDEPDPDLAADMMIEADEVLSAAGLHRYEVANYSVAGAESRHNTSYWKGTPYAGVGPGAHSMLTPDLAETVSAGVPWLAAAAGTPEGSRARFCADADLEGFLAGPWEGPPASIELLTPEDAAREDIMLGMRLSRGVPDDRVGESRLTGVLESLERDGLVAHDAGRWRTTQRGWLLGNEVFGRIWDTDDR